MGAALELGALGYNQWFKMWSIHDETVALERFLSWPNRAFAAIGNAISVFKFLIMTETTITTETAFWITGPTIERGHNPNQERRREPCWRERRARPDGSVGPRLALENRPIWLVFFILSLFFLVSSSLLVLFAPNTHIFIKVLFPKNSSKTN